MNIRAGHTVHLSECACGTPEEPWPHSLVHPGNLRWCLNLRDALGDLHFLAIRAQEARRNGGPRESLYYAVHVRILGEWWHVLHARKNDGKLPWEVKHNL